MSFRDHMVNFAGKAVIDWKPDVAADPGKNAIALRLDWDAANGGETWGDLFNDYLITPEASGTSALIVGSWGNVAEGGNSVAIIKALADHRGKLPALSALFIGDIIGEECEVSWITQSDVGPILAAYPGLREFGVRGGNELHFNVSRHASLQKLVIESGGLDAGVVRQVLACDLPELTHLELWLGDGGYGATTAVEDLRPLLAGKLFPKLRYLGLRNSEIADEVAVAVAECPLLYRLATLDLSMGTLGDEGAEALVAAPTLAKLAHLDIHHHYVSEEIVERLRSRCASVNADQREGDSDDKDDRYVAVGE